MKLPGLLLLLGLLASAAGPAPVVRVTFSALTDAAYMATPRRKVAAKPRVTFPLSKQHGRIAIPTAKGPRIFRDVVVDAQSEYSESQAITYKYLGYFPAQHCHLGVAAVAGDTTTASAKTITAARMRCVMMSILRVVHDAFI